METDRSVGAILRLSVATLPLAGRTAAADGPTVVFELVGDLVAMLPELRRPTFTLVEVKGLTQREAAEEFGVSLQTVKWRTSRAWALLRDAATEGDGRRSASR